MCIQYVEFHKSIELFKLNFKTDDLTVDLQVSHQVIMQLLLHSRLESGRESEAVGRMVSYCGAFEVASGVRKPPPSQLAFKISIIEISIIEISICRATGSGDADKPTRRNPNPGLVLTLTLLWLLNFNICFSWRTPSVGPIQKNSKSWIWTQIDRF